MLAEKVAVYIAREHPTVAPYAGNGETRLRITVRAKDEAEAQQLIQPVEAEIRQIVGLDCYGADEDTLASAVARLLQERHQTVAVAESCTGGGLGEMLTRLPGSSLYFKGGVIAYANEVKVNLLGVNPQDLEQEGAVSAVVAAQMALGVKTRLASDWGVSITGIAGPGGATLTKPVGLVYIGVALPNGEVITREFRLSGQRGRDWVRHLSMMNALDVLRRQLLVNP